MTRAAVRLLLIWVVVWPMVMGGLKALAAFAPDLSFALRTATLSGVLVPTIALLVAPAAARIALRLMP